MIYRELVSYPHIHIWLFGPNEEEEKLTNTACRNCRSKLCISYNKRDSVVPDHFRVIHNRCPPSGLESGFFLPNEHSLSLKFLQTCRQVHQEAVSAVYSLLSFYFEDYKTLQDFKGQISTKAKLSIRDVHIQDDMREQALSLKHAWHLFNPAQSLLRNTQNLTITLTNFRDKYSPQEGFTIDVDEVNATCDALLTFDNTLRRLSLIIEPMISQRDSFADAQWKALLWSGEEIAAFVEAVRSKLISHQVAIKGKEIGYADAKFVLYAPIGG